MTLFLLYCMITSLDSGYGATSPGKPDLFDIIFDSDVDPTSRTHILDVPLANCGVQRLTLYKNPRELQNGHAS